MPLSWLRKKAQQLVTPKASQPTGKPTEEGQAAGLRARFKAKSPEGAGLSQASPLQRYLEKAAVREPPEAAGQRSPLPSQPDARGDDLWGKALSQAKAPLDEVSAGLPLGSPGPRGAPDGRVDSASPRPPDPVVRWERADIGSRLLAQTLDGILVLFLVGLLSSLLGDGLSGVLTSVLPFGEVLFEQGFEEGVSSPAADLAWVVLLILTLVLYTGWAIQERSATFGKRALGLELRPLLGEQPVGFSRGALREVLGKWLPVVTLPLFWILQPQSEPPSWVAVIGWVGLWQFFLLITLSISGEERLAAQDRIFSTRVMRRILVQPEQNLKSVP